MPKPRRPITPAYIFFYILFLPDTWRILIGVLIAVLLTPAVLKPEMASASRIMLYIMMATIGYAASGKPGRWISGFCKRFILQGHR